MASPPGFGDSYTLYLSSHRHSISLIRCVFPSLRCVAIAVDLPFGDARLLRSEILAHFVAWEGAYFRTKAPLKYPLPSARDRCAEWPPNIQAELF